MAWIESHQQLERHPKTHVLMSNMKWDLDTTIGKLHRFWWWVLDFAPTGDLRKFNDATLGGSVGLSGECAIQFVRSMVEACWLDRGDGVFRVHDWPHYAGRYLQESKFKRNPERWKEVQDLYSKTCDCPRTVQGLSELPTNQPTNPPDPPHAGSESQEEWLGRLQHLYPDRDVEGELRSLKKLADKDGTPVTRRRFEAWIRKASESVKVSKPRVKCDQPIPDDPPAWKEWRNENYPDADKKIPFAKVSLEIQKQFERATKAD